jgi:predicted O-methyltransferase YrrM
MTPKEYMNAVRLPHWPPLIVEYVHGILVNTMRVFEFGSGASSIWLAKRAGSVTSVEHDDRWLVAVGDMAPHNLKLVKAPLPYHEEINEAGGEFDLIVVDGRDRVNCVSAAIPRLKDGGYLLLDDSHRGRYYKATMAMTMRDWPCITGSMVKKGQGYSQECLIVKKA